jgi:hypothetical protein
MLRHLLLLLILLPASVLARADESLEYEVKAAFLFNFAKFVEWGDDAFSSPQEPLTLCVLGRDPFGPALDETIRGEQVENRALAIRRVENEAAAEGCHILFVAASERRRFSAILKSVNTRRILTVSEVPEFLDAGGHFSFYLEGNRVRFAANADAVSSFDHQVSAKLLQVARIHKPKRAAG